MLTNAQIRLHTRVKFNEMDWKGSIVEVSPEIRIRWDDKPSGDETTYGVFSRSMAKKELSEVEP